MTPHSPSTEGPSVGDKRTNRAQDLNPLKTTLRWGCEPPFNRCPALILVQGTDKVAAVCELFFLNCAPVAAHMQTTMTVRKRTVLGRISLRLAKNDIEYIQMELDGENLSRGTVDQLDATVCMSGTGGGCSGVEEEMFDLLDSLFFVYQGLSSVNL